MRWTKTLIPTLRQTPADAVVPSHQLMLRAGLIEQVAAGAFNYLPLGTRVLHKVMNIIRQEMDAAGALEVLMPTVQPIEWWEQTGRRGAYGENLFVVKDRHGRELALGPTHEEVITMLVKSHVQSYKQLPLTLYQIQTKFRDEFRPRFGVLRSREFQMKDAYSFDLTAQGLDESYRVMYEAYRRIFDRCGLRYVIVDAESGEMGGSASQQFTVLSPVGEDTIFSSDKGNYAANLEKCGIGDRPSDPQGAPTGLLEKVHTPGFATIDEVGKFMKVKPRNMLKTIVFESMGDKDGRADPTAPSHWALVVVRGDHDVNEEKVRRLIQDRWGARHVALADQNRAKEREGFAIGYVGPHAAVGKPNVCVIADPDAVQPGFWATGANEPDHHVKHFNWNRELIERLGSRAAELFIVADVRNAVDGDPSPRNDGGVLKSAKGIEVGQVFKLGYKYSEALDLSVLDEKQGRIKVIMGCYGIGVNRIVASAIESQGGHDERGIIWPRSIAPYHVVLTPVRYEGAVKETVDRIYRELTDAGVEVLLDDREERPGVKFNDADLIGIPLRLTIGDKVLATGEVEFKPRAAAKAEMVKLDQVVGRVVAFIEQ